MKFRSTHKHTIDLLFPIALLFVFAACAVTVILFAAGIYENTITQSHQNHQARTVVAYISEKVRQNDTADSISITTLDGREALCFRQTYHQEAYHTYLYYYDGYLRELFVKENTVFSPADGRGILPLQSFTLEAIDANLMYMSCTDTDRQTVSAYLTIRTQQE